MGKILKFPSLDKYLDDLKSSGGLWKIDGGKHAIKHLEVEKMAKAFGVKTSIEYVDGDIAKSCAIVKAIAIHQGDHFETLGEAAPYNNNFSYPVAIAEKRAVDRAVLKALGIHGNYYSDAELDNAQINLKDLADVIKDRIKNITSIANLDELMSDNKEYLLKLKKENSAKALEIKKSFEDRKQQLIGG
tara:strand:- start:509 stop:1072 length:564 start_codon:yes stop_codon:yes gene_type:complete